MTFSTKLLEWYDHHGRHDLPWQTSGEPYQTWVSEIMLQQTRVTTVIPYFERFISRFPDIRSLANADIDQVLHHWSGLGYYARARNLHRAAGMIESEFDGRFPTAIEDVMRLPGIGRSTAAAILAQSLDQRHAILDGNVKRVLCRYAMIRGWPGSSETQRRLWTLSEQLTPQSRVRDYTQAVMDLGATLCTRNQPDCPTCPVNDDCLSYLNDAVAEYPAAKPARKMPVRKTNMLLIRNDKEQICLLQRPSTGLWGGLWSLPEFDGDALDWARTRLGIRIETWPARPAFRHTFSHFHLDISVIPAKLARSQDARVMEADNIVWYNPAGKQELGLAAPVEKIIRGEK
jgi:A/G-specific adenine glycosylase